MISMFQAEELAALACHTAVTSTLACSPELGVHRLNPEAGIALADPEEQRALDAMTQIACTLWFDDLTSGGDHEPMDDLYDNVLKAWGAGVLDD